MRWWLLFKRLVARLSRITNRPHPRIVLSLAEFRDELPLFEPESVEFPLSVDSVFEVPESELFCDNELDAGSNAGCVPVESLPPRHTSTNSLCAVAMSVVDSSWTNGISAVPSSLLVKLPKLPRKYVLRTGRRNVIKPKENLYSMN